MRLTLALARRRLRRAPWIFEEVGMVDIPLDVHQVCALTGAKKINVFAHFMRSATLSKLALPATVHAAKQVRLSDRFVAASLLL
jgi:hypothetical protein